MTVRDHLAFTLAMQRAIAPDGTQNCCWSPFSVASALGLTAAGAAGATRDELCSLLIGAGEGNLDEAAKLLAIGAELDAVIGRAEPPVLAVANTLWTRAGVRIEPDYAAQLGRWPGGAVRDAPFDVDTERARGLINADVADTTRELIPNLLPPDSISPDTAAMLVNALYLKSAWVTAFPEQATAPAPFHGIAGSRAVDTMHLTARLGYAARRGWQVVRLGAQGGLDALVLLPDGDLATAESALTVDVLADLLAAPIAERVELWLPKLDVTGRSDLGPVLGALGVRTLFSARADLSGLSTSNRLTVDSVRHEAVLRVDESGVEGAAATAVMIRALSMVREAEPVQVRVDRPFLFLVRRADGPIHFLARVTDPSVRCS